MIMIKNTVMMLVSTPTATIMFTTIEMIITDIATVTVTSTLMQLSFMSLVM